MIKKLALCALLASLPALAAGPLDGKTFRGTATVVGEAKGRSIDLVFADGRFRSSAGERFGTGPYTAKRVGDAWNFRARVSSEGRGTMDWRGVITGDVLTGTATWTRSGEEPVNYRIEAQLQ